MTSEILHFKADPLWIIKQLIQIYYENHVNNDKSLTDAYNFAVGKVAVMHRENSLTDEEVDAIAEKYAEQNNLDEISLTGDIEQQKAFYELMLELPRIKEFEHEYLLKGYGKHELSVVDRSTMIEYQCRLGDHYQTMMQIIKEHYWDDFIVLSIDEKDAFLMERFALIGATNNRSWYNYSHHC